MLEGVSLTRNEKLAHVLHRLEIIEAYGTGIPRIYGAYEPFPMKPEIPIVSGGFLVKLPNLNYEQILIKLDKKRYEQMILNAFPSGKFTKDDVAKILNITANGAYRILTRMNEKGLLEIRKEGRKWTYVVIQTLNIP